MKKLTLLILSCTFVQFTQAQIEGLYQDEVFDEVSVNTETYSTPYNLQVDIYQAVDSQEENRPLLILAHGGSFIGGVRQNPTMVTLGNSFAKRGYVVASISYRLMGLLDLFSEEAALNGVAEAIGDGRAAVRYFRKSIEEGNPYKINPNQIFFGGNSAGGLIALHVGFMQEEDITDVLLLEALANNGGIEGNSGNPGYSSEISGAISLSGALADVNFISIGEDDIAIITCHGDQDETVPYYCGAPLGGIYQLPELCGAGSIYDHTQAISFDNHNHLLFEGSGHTPWEFSESAQEQMINFVSEHLYNALDYSVGVEELSADFSIYPNPVKNILNVESIKSIYKLIIRNIKGDEILNINNGKQADISSLPQGVYILDIEGEGQQGRQKFIKL